jgi:hypothetical protein
MRAQQNGRQDPASACSFHSTSAALPSQARLGGADADAEPLPIVDAAGDCRGGPVADPRAIGSVRRHAENRNRQRMRGDGAADKEQIGQWAALGGRAFAREARLTEEGKEAIVLAFPAPLDRDATTVLRDAGFRFNKLLRHWEGLARFDEASTLAAAQGGAARRVAVASPPSPAPVADRAAE